MASNRRSRRAEVRLSTILLLAALALPFLVGDYITTSMLVFGDAGKMEREANPIVASLYVDYGHSGVLMAKISTFLMIGAVAFLIDMKFRDRLDKLKDGAMLTLIAVYMFVVLNNTLVMYTLGTF
ncbi:MAG: hypothetical protein ACE5KA_08905 [Nitrososphaerales archaeon]